MTPRDDMARAGDPAPPRHRPADGPGGGTTPAGAAPPSWGALTAAALLGTERRTPPGAVPGDDPAAALLDAAAAATVRGRAGLRPAPARPRPAPAPPDPRPPLPAAARRRLAQLLGDRPGPGSGGGRRGTAPDLAELLPQWLSAAVRHGFRPPDVLLPPLLDAARARTDLRPAALALAGPRALWLARSNPDWRFALRGTVPPVPGAAVRAGEAAGGQEAAAPATTAAPGPAGPAGGAGPAGTAHPAGATPAGDPAPVGDPAPAGDVVPVGGPALLGDAAPVGEAARRLWAEGLFAERAALLEALRRRDPATARALLDSGWRTERAEDRLMFLETLRTGLSPADEPFLERALADRSRNVRATAAELLSALPGSAYAARMAARALPCLTLHRTPSGPLVTVDPPCECDAAMQRDGVVPRPPAGRGERVWWLAQLVEATPLPLWSARFGGRSPAAVAALPVADGRQPELHAAWGRAAVRQRDAAWARALLGAPAAHPGAAPGAASPGERTRLLSVLPADERAAWVAGFIAAHGLAESFQPLAACAVPWAPPLGRAVVDALDIAREAGSYPWSFSGVMGLAERCLDPDEAGRLDLLTAATEDPEEASPGAGGYWSEAFQRLVRTLRLRRTMLDELDGAELDGGATEGPGTTGTTGTTGKAESAPAGAGTSGAGTGGGRAESAPRAGTSPAEQAGTPAGAAATATGPAAVPPGTAPGGITRTGPRSRHGPAAPGGPPAPPAPGRRPGDSG
ncbi:DUF5691 domain-containing protein [Streptomyces zingiberis]|uniref:DUF5691 domain-containing protein n=1 Tax=Streptomyces zingiberis TaxID=2053010 RepID=UPI001F105327|nr:DUF5691 domain-containing protein [Streptomyces zingiberis]